MKKKIGIYYNAKFEESSFETGCGGSDTWVIQIAKQFVKHGFHTMVFCDCPNWCILESGVEYIPIRLFNMRCQYQNFDYFIMTRSVDEDVYNTIVDTGCTHIYIQSHDLFIWGKDMYNEKYVYDPEKYPHLEYIALTNFHKENIHNFNEIPYDKIHVIGNGLDSDTFTKVDMQNIKKDNSILFPSVYSRGGDILVKNILPLVLKEIPDFEVHLCGYSDRFPREIYLNSHVKILGMLSKEDYYKEFKKHKVWFLPCVVPEDFGLCVCEAVMCGCDVVSTFEHGMKDVCWPFTNLKMRNKFNVKDTGWYHYSRYELDMSQEDFDKTCQEAAKKIIDSIKNYYNEDRINLRESFKKFLLGEHNWNNVVEKWKNVFVKK